MTIDWPRLGNYLYGNKVSILAFFTLLFTSGVKTLPPPGLPFMVYFWFYDWSHQFFHIENNRLAREAIPSPPLPAAVASEDPVVVQKK